MTRDELKKQIDELMRQYDAEEIDGATYVQKMAELTTSARRLKMTRDELKKQIDELMRQYDAEEIDGATYVQKMAELTTSAQNEGDDE